MENLRIKLDQDIEQLKNGTAIERAKAEQHLRDFIALVLD